MPRFIVERYLPDASHEALRAIVTDIASAPLPPGVSLIRSVLALCDEAIFCEYEATDEPAVREANERAGLPFERVVPIELHLSRTSGDAAGR